MDALGAAKIAWIAANIPSPPVPRKLHGLPQKFHRPQCRENCIALGDRENCIAPKPASRASRLAHPEVTADCVNFVVTARILNVSA
jgi:hypothetical protein